MNAARPGTSVPRLVAVAAAVTLAVTLLRLLGELRGWAPALFGRDAGGAGALIGIGWLIPVFGAWFGVHLARAGALPPSWPRAFALPSAGILLIGVTFTVVTVFFRPTGGVFAAVAVALPIYALLAFAAWPSLARALLAYALAARVPVCLVTVVAVANGWDTHYEKLAPGSAEFGPAARTAILCTAQLVIWVPLTLLGGGLAAACAAWLAAKTGSETLPSRSRAPTPPTSGRSSP